jgi:hypothetical protein
VPNVAIRVPARILWVSFMVSVSESF